MNRDEILAKIKKSLALSKSTNEHEASIALKQAQHLIKKYQISDHDLRLSQVTEERTITRNKRSSDLEECLAGMIAYVFECGFYVDWHYEYEDGDYVIYQVYVFYGIDPNTSIAQYAFQVLEPILKKHKSAYLKTLHGNIRLKNKRKLGIIYHRAWVNTVKDQCRVLMPNEELKQSLQLYKESIDGLKIMSLKKVEYQSKDLERISNAISKARSDAKTVELYQAVGGI